MLTVDRLREMLSYCPQSGAFRWKQNRRGGCKAGDVAGIIHKKGYRFIKIDGRRFSAHRLAWLYVTGNWPAALVDHINRQRDDNRFENLREATASQNRMNTKATGVKFYETHGKWKAQIGRNGRQIYLGMFNSRDEALAARRAAELDLHGDFAPARGGNGSTPLGAS